VFIRLFTLTALFFFNLYGCQGGYASCVAKVRDAKVIKGSALFIPINKNQRLVYAKNPPHAEIVKYDPFLSLYIIKDKHPFAYPFDINMRLQLGVAMVTKSCAVEGKFHSRQIGLNQLASFSEKLLTPSLLTSSCCSLEGIVTERGIIQKEYLRHFIKTKGSSYGDIGVRLADKQGVRVVASDPFMKNNPFKKGDRLLAFDGKNLHLAAEYMQKILFSRVGSKHTVLIKRASQTRTLHVKTQKRYGGGDISDTFLESRGLYFDRRLSLVKIEKKFKNYGIKKGDRLIQIDGVLVKNQKELREYLQSAKDYTSLLFERDGFEFFVNIK